MNIINVACFVFLKLCQDIFQNTNLHNRVDNDDSLSFPQCRYYFKLKAWCVVLDICNIEVNIYSLTMVKIMVLTFVVFKSASQKTSALCFGEVAKQVKVSIQKKYGIIWEFFPTWGGSSQFPKLLLFYHSPKNPLKTP